MALFKTIVVFAITIFTMITAIPLAILAFILSCLGLKRSMSWVTYEIGQIWALTLIKCTGCDLQVRGKEHIPPRGGVCFVCNHGGVFDIILALALIGRPFGFIAKKELLLVPFIDMWIFLLGGLFIDRKNIKKALATINKGVRRLKEGSGILVFPEGTRSKGQGLLPFHSGSLKLATQAGVPIVPMAISGSYDVFEKNYQVHAVPVRVVFLPPISTADLSAEDRKKNLSDHIRGVIEAALLSR
ncbi:MAG: 1-acyl-sn-glycerol-3-phosphate acyltransferase [Treponema sp.]|jgi:1-acyl-sn-glycerol-3-phosphate acyltransferase|nr:1-acyl-sn-glycerol-3-phosphate acyltransferase [Treponema sp.]